MNFKLNYHHPQQPALFRSRAPNFTHARPCDQEVAHSTSPLKSRPLSSLPSHRRSNPISRPTHSLGMQQGSEIAIPETVEPGWHPRLGLGPIVAAVEILMHRGGTSFSASLSMMRSVIAEFRNLCIQPVADVDFPIDGRSMAVIRRIGHLRRVFQLW